MKAKIIAQIAAEKLGLETLETRNSDRLDFSEQAVWTLRAALEAAFEAGLAARTPMKVYQPMGDPNALVGAGLN